MYRSPMSELTTSPVNFVSGHASLNPRRVPTVMFQLLAGDQHLIPLT